MKCKNDNFAIEINNFNRICQSEDKYQMELAFFLYLYEMYFVYCMGVLWGHMVSRVSEWR